MLRACLDVSPRAGSPGPRGVAGRLAGLGSDPLDDEELRGRKRLLVLVAVLILPVATAWGVIYLVFGSPVGILPFLYVIASVGLLLVFSRTRGFDLLLNVQLLDILVMPTLGQMFTGGFLPSGVVGLWAILAPLGALAFLEVSRAIRWFVAFVVVFLLTGILGEVLFADADLPRWFTSMMLALNVVGAGGSRSRSLATFANQRNAAEAAVRVEQQRSELLLLNILPRPIADRLKADGRMIADHFDAASIVFADVVDFTPLAQGLRPPRSWVCSTACSHASTRSSSATASRRSRRSAIATWPSRACRNPPGITRAAPRRSRSTCVRRSPARPSSRGSASSCGSASTPARSLPAS